MIIQLGEAIELIEQQLKEQNCLQDSMEELRLMQPHLYAWISFFNLEERFTKTHEGDKQ